MISHDTMIQKKRTSHLQNWRWNLTIGIPHMLRRLFPPYRPFGSRTGIAAGMQNTGWSRWVHPMFSLGHFKHGFFCFVVFDEFGWRWGTSFVDDFDGIFPFCWNFDDGSTNRFKVFPVLHRAVCEGGWGAIDSKFSPSCIELFVRAVEGRHGQMVILSYSRGNMKHCPSWLPDDWVIWMFLVFFFNLAYERVYF